MSDECVKTHYSAQELADLSLPGIPSTRVGIAVKAKRDKWASRVREMKGGGVEYHIDSLPTETQKALRQRLAYQVLEDAQLPAVVEQKAVKNVAVRDELEVMVKCPELALREVQALTDKQKAIADARILLATEVHKLREYAGMTRKAALKHIVDGVRMGALPDRIIEAANTANARQGKRTGVSTGSLDSWYSSWVMARGDANQLLALLAPGHHKGTPWEQVWWLSDFFMFYRSWKRPTVEYAYREFSAWWHEKHANDAGMLAALPSVHAVRRVLSSVPVIVKERFRSTGSAWRSLNPFVRRDWSTLPVNAVWVGDGHCMKLMAFNPATGNTFRPEVTLVMDAGQRFIVGWSLSLSENVIAVADALRHGMSQHGIPLIYYSDNGGGEKNRVLDADITGILPRLGVEHHTGIPGNPQGRGVIERANKGIPKDVALSFQTYCSKNADKETVMMQQRITQSAIKATHKGKELTKRQVKAMGEVPTFEQLMAAIELEVKRYNNRPHSSLPRKEDGEHYSPAAYRRKLIKEQKAEIDMLSPEELHEMFRPESICTVRRGEVVLFRNIYFSTELAAEHGNEVRVCYDIHDANSVIVRRMDGSYICDAIWNGNKVDAFPKAVIEQQQEKRARGRIARATQKIEEAKRELTPAITQRPDFNFGFGLERKEEKKKEELYFFASERDRNLKKDGTNNR
ncbi:TPA: transposase [Escherichia coli]|nr:transposase [Escherichia coli]